MAEYAGIEDSIEMYVEACDRLGGMLPRETAAALIRAVVACPDGVQKMSMAMPGLVQTSTNLARVVSDGRTVKAAVPASQLGAGVRNAPWASRLRRFCAGRGPNRTHGRVRRLEPEHGLSDPAGDDGLLRAPFRSEPAVTAIHAGLECGIIGSNYPGLDMISFGPTICYPHSPDEKVEIASVGKFYDFLTDTLRNIPEK